MEEQAGQEEVQTGTIQPGQLVPKCVLLGGRCDAEQPENGDTGRGDRTGHRVKPQQVSAVHREARHQHRRYDGRHEHRGGDDGVSGRHGSDFMVPHDEDCPYLQRQAKTTDKIQINYLKMLI